MHPVDVGSIHLERAFAAPVDEVFNAWTNPDVLRRWWAAQRMWTSPGCEVDLRVGGRYRLRMEDDDTGQVHAVAGEFREVDPPSRLVYTWAWEGSDGLHPGHVSLVTVEFEPAGEGTLVRLDHTGLASEESVTRHTHGWNGVLENLELRIFDQGEE